MDFKTRPLNQSLIKKFVYRGDERELLCPYNIYSIDIQGKYKFQTESMLKGSYFETLCLTKGAGGKITNDLPRKKLIKKQEIENIKRIAQGLEPLPGNKTEDHLRIDEQAKRFYHLADKYQITVSEGNTQVRIVIPWHKDENIHLSMEFDIFPTAIMTNSGLKLAVIDLKLTTDVNSTYGEFCWGSPEYMDITQALMYTYGIKQVINHVEMNPHLRDILSKPAVNLINNGGLEFFYWVFSYKKLEDKLIKVVWDSTRESELHETINKAISMIEYYEGLGWPTKPDYRLCKNCPILECPEKQHIQTI